LAKGFEKIKKMKFSLFLGVFLILLIIFEEAEAKNSKLIAKIGDRVIIPCSRSKDLIITPPVAWKRRSEDTESFTNIAILGTSVTPLSKRMHIFPENGSLLISDLKPNDSGEYSCDLFVVGSQPFFHQLDVLPVPQLQIIVHDVSNSNETATVATCHVVNTTKTKSLKWLGFNQDPAKVSNATKLNENKIVNLSLDLQMQASLSNDKKSIVCEFKNAFGEIMSQNATVTILAPTTPAPTTPPLMPPTINEFPKKTAIILNLNETRSFKCSGAGNPLPRCQWYKNMDPIEADQIQPHTSILTINSANFHDSGKYQCKVYTSTDEALSPMLSIKVLGFSEVKEEKNESIIIPQNHQEVSFTCDAVSNPVASFTWSLGDDLDVLEGYNSTITNLNFTTRSVLILPAEMFEVDSVTKVKCEARTSHGTDFRTFWVTRETGQMVQGRLVAIFIIVGIFVVVCISAIFYAMRRNARASNDAESRCGFLVCAKTDTTKIAEKANDEEEVQEEEDLNEKLTKTEDDEKPKESRDEDVLEEDEVVVEEEKMLKDQQTAPKMRIIPSFACCRRSRKKLEEEDDVDEKNQEEAANENEALNPEEEKSEEKVLESITEENTKEKVEDENEEFDRDSGKGDTLKPVTSGDNDVTN